MFKPRDVGNCPCGLSGIWWLFRSVCAEFFFSLALLIAPKNYAGFWAWDAREWKVTRIDTSDRAQLEWSIETALHRLAPGSTGVVDSPLNLEWSTTASGELITGEEVRAFGTGRKSEWRG